MSPTRQDGPPLVPHDTLSACYVAGRPDLLRVRRTLRMLRPAPGAVKAVRRNSRRPGDAGPRRTRGPGSRARTRRSSPGGRRPSSTSFSTVQYCVAVSKTLMRAMGGPHAAPASPRRGSGHVVLPEAGLQGPTRLADRRENPRVSHLDTVPTRTSTTELVPRLGSPVQTGSFSPPNVRYMTDRCSEACSLGRLGTRTDPRAAGTLVRAAHVIRRMVTDGPWRHVASLLPDGIPACADTRAAFPLHSLTVYGPRNTRILER